MKLLDTAGKTAKKVAAAVVKAIAPEEPSRSRDPWYSDAPRRAALEGRGRWLGPRRRGGWLR